MKIVNPQTERLISERNALLQTTMRPEPLPFSVEEEYPIVLHPKDAQFSYCAVEQDQMVAHANLWPRTFVCGTEKIKVGLIGNVATHEAWRGKGVMTHLFEHLTKEAKAQKFDALILWSDLHQFYQKLGYASLGEEYRFFFDSQTLQNECKSHTRQFLPIAKKALNAKLLKEIQGLRYKTPATLERSVEEFHRLLQIPATTLFCSRDKGELKGFCIVGKGFDMAGVVHEWGATDPQTLLIGLRDTLSQLEIPEIILLCPQAIATTWKNRFAGIAKRVEKHPMALVLNLSERKDFTKTLSEGFIWGLDSI